MGFFLFGILMVNKNKRNYPIAFLVLSFSAILFSYVLYWTKYNTIISYFNSFQFIGYYSTGPLLYLYIHKLYNIKMKYFALHFILTVLWVFLTLVIWCRYIFDYQFGFSPIFTFFANYILIISHLMIYFFLILRLIKKNNKTETEFEKIRY
ncbi:hypothetical protein WPG_0477 [Winogradskyella sp. PG-2]|nr:hypothetical protein WPG_0477 [Winogradskyella sp. PG-2]